MLGSCSHVQGLPTYEVNFLWAHPLIWSLLHFMSMRIYAFWVQLQYSTKIALALAFWRDKEVTFESSSCVNRGHCLPCRKSVANIWSKVSMVNSYKATGQEDAALILFKSAHSHSITLGTMNELNVYKVRICRSSLIREVFLSRTHTKCEVANWRG